MEPQPGLPAPRPGLYLHEISVRWGDCDPALIAYTARLPAFALEAIDAWWERMLGGDGWYQMNMDRGFGTPFVGMKLDFRKPVTPRHRLICATWPTRLGTTSIGFAVDGYQGGELRFSGRFTCVFVASESFTKRVPPPDIGALLAPMIAAAPPE